MLRRRQLKGGTLLLAKTLPNPLKKPWFWGGEAALGTVLGGEIQGRGRSAEGEARNPGPPKSIKIKENHQNTKAKATSEFTKA